MKEQYTTSYRSYAIALLVFWCLVVLGLGSWKINQNNKNIRDLAEHQARANFNKDKAFRLWLTGHGRIYIPTGDNYEPDEFLANVPERDITTPSGVELSLINPARIVRELIQDYEGVFLASSRVTHPNPLRPENKPDAWESEALERLYEGDPEVFEYTEKGGEPYLRLIQPLPVEEGCLLCHPNQGMQVGGVGGAVTIALPLKELYERQTRESSKDIRLFFTLWLVGTLGIWGGYLHLRRQTLEKTHAVQALAKSELHNTSIREYALDSIISIDSSGCIVNVNPATERTFGYTREQMIGHDVAEMIIPPAYREKHRAGLQRYQQTGRSSIIGTRIDTWALHAEGYEFPVELAVSKFEAEDGIFFTAYLRDLTEARELQEKLTYQASHDSLTGLINRRAFEERLQHLVGETSDGQSHGLLFLDLDQFKVINDSCGHAAGDELLRQLGVLLKNRIRASDTLARLGGDEFAVLLEGCSVEKSGDVAEGLIDAVRNYRFHWKEKIFSIGVSIGIVPIQEQGINHSELLSAADAACYKAKEEGRNRLYLFRADDQDLANRRGDMGWVNRIQSALENDQFVLYKQSLMPLCVDNPGDKLHCEILLRMRDEDGEIIPPDHFISPAERFNLMPTIDRWVVSRTLQWLAATPELMDRVELCSINLSGFSVTDPMFIGFIGGQFEQHSIPPELICFEITETAAITNLAKATHFIDELRHIGCKFALDDFGRGMSSFGYLQSLPIDYIKIDGEFVRDITRNEINRAMVKSINDIGKVMGKSTIAEFVEDQATVDILCEMGVDYAQGNYYSHPIPIEQFFQLNSDEQKTG